jgi:hypothetical protein
VCDRKVIASMVTQLTTRTAMMNTQR